MYLRAGILTGYPSVSPFGYTLGPPNPWLITIAKETFGFRRPGISSGLWLLMPTFLLRSAPPFLTEELHSPTNTPLPPPHLAMLGGWNFQFSIINFQ